MGRFLNTTFAAATSLFFVSKYSTMNIAEPWLSLVAGVTTLGVFAVFDFDFQRLPKKTRLGRRIVTPSSAVFEGWWGQVFQQTPPHISILQIFPRLEDGTGLVVRGTAYHQNGKVYGDFETDNALVEANTRTLSYEWSSSIIDDDPSGVPSRGYAKLKLYQTRSMFRRPGGTGWLVGKGEVTPFREFALIPIDDKMLSEAKVQKVELEKGLGIQKIVQVLAAKRSEIYAVKENDEE